MVDLLTFLAALETYVVVHPWWKFMLIAQETIRFGLS